MATYYVKNGGSDSSNGLTDGTAWAHHPWMTGWTAGSKSLAPGDIVCLKCGDVWVDKIIVAQSGASGNPITSTSYGVGEMPIITGFTTLSSWTLYSGSIYYATLSSEAQTNMVTVDGVNTGMGRWPDTGYRLFESYNNTALTITDTQLSEETPFSWIGADVVIRKNNWNIERCNVTNQSGDVITYSNNDGTSGVIGNNYGYFIINDLRAVTVTNEWYHDHSANRLYIYGNPSGKIVKAATKGRLVYNNGYDYITFNNISFEGSIGNAIDAVSTSIEFTVDNCDIRYAGNFGISLTNNPNNCVISNNIISDVHGSGIRVWGGTGNTVSWNNVENCGMIVGMGYVGFWHCGIYTVSPNCDIIHNSVKNTCGNGIISDGLNNLIQYNYVENASMRTIDSGGIYVGSNSGNYTIVDHNIIYNVPGDGSGTPYSSNPLARGLYIDDFAQYLTITNNVVHTSTESAFMFHDGNDCTIRYNIFYNSKYGAYYLSSSTASIRRNIIDHNQFVAVGATQYTTFAFTHSSDPGGISLFGTIDYNIHARPINQTTSQSHFRTWDGGYVDRTLASWRSFTGHDTHSTYNLGGAISSTDDIRLIFNNTMSDKNFQLSASMKGLDNTTYSGIITLSAFTGLVLIGAGTVTETEDPSEITYVEIVHAKINKYSVL